MAVKISNGCKRYAGRGNFVLNRLNMDVRRGEMYVKNYRDCVQNCVIYYAIMYSMHVYTHSYGLLGSSGCG